MRIIAGAFKSRLLAAPKGTQTRPTTDRARESVFNVLQNSFDLEGARALDLFAGSGAFGLEALSRGAGHATFVERNKNALAAVRNNIASLGVEGRATIHATDVYSFLKTNRSAPFDLIFSDAPYEDARALTELPSLLFEGGWLSNSGIALLEHRAGTSIAVPETAFWKRELKAGEAAFSLLTHKNLSA